jgi:hypothetical protein
MNELDKKIERLQAFRDLVKSKHYLQKIQVNYNMPVKELIEYIREIEIKLLTNVPLDRDNKVFCNTLERILNP